MEFAQRDSIRATQRRKAQTNGARITECVSPRTLTLAAAGLRVELAAQGQTRGRPNHTE